MAIVKLKVCTNCLSPNIIDAECRCVWDKHYPTIELDFEQCDHCGHTSDQPADTAFNDEQLYDPEEEPEEEP
jgi:hypothetical protein